MFKMMINDHQQQMLVLIALLTGICLLQQLV